MKWYDKLLIGTVCLLLLSNVVIYSAWYFKVQNAPVKPTYTLPPLPSFPPQPSGSQPTDIPGIYYTPQMSKATSSPQFYTPSAMPKKPVCLFLMNKEVCEE